MNSQLKSKKKKHRAGKIIREYRDISRFRWNKKLKANSNPNYVKSDRRVFLSENFISALTIKAKFLFYLPENFTSQKFCQPITTNVEFDSFYNYYLEIIKYKDIIESPSSELANLITQLKSQLPENQCEIENYLQTLQWNLRATIKIFSP